MPESPTSTSLQLTGSVYDHLKRLTTFILPGLSTLYFTLAQIWGLPAAEQVVGTITAVSLFLGVLMNLSAKSFNSDNNVVAGVINVQNTAEGGKIYTLDVNGGPENIDGKNEVRFKINET